jgi:methylthioribose-1-phosphate isomerase
VEPIRSVRWNDARDAVVIIDQRRLPEAFVETELRSAGEVRHAIETLAVRGAPAIGVAAALGLVTSLRALVNGSRAAFDTHRDANARTLSGARPTAVNLAWAVDRVRSRGAATIGSAEVALDAMRDEANAILEEDRAMCDAIGRHGLEFVRYGARVLTHCNAGALATAGIGTALAPVYLAHREGRRVSVTADETRPLLQGSRLTAWELARAGIPVRVIADNMAASLLRKGEVDVVLVGADRIAANGDTANKIGTYGLALAARANSVPFVVCAPTSTIDPATASGAEMTIEERDAGEVLAFRGASVAAEGVGAWNPAFDITPAALITAIVTDHGVHLPPFHFVA